MYDFAIVALLALGTVKVVDFLTDNVSPLRAWKSVLTFIAAVGVVVALDYSLFQGFGAPCATRRSASGSRASWSQERPWAGGPSSAT